MRKVIAHLKSNFYLDIIAIMFLLLSFFIEPLISLSSGNGFVFNLYEQVFKGYLRIITSPSILITDYVYIAGIGATLFNVATILITNMILLRLLRIEMTGPVYAGLIMICGFSFFGKNIFNAFPIYLGIYIYSLFKRVPFKSYILTVLFSTGISPLVSYAIFGFGIPYYFSIPLGIISGMIVGFILPAFAAHTIVFHEGYNLYNTGFALGILSAMFYGIFNLFQLKTVAVALYDYSSSTVFYYLLPLLSGLSILFGIMGDRGVFKKYYAMLKTSGRLISDYAAEFGKEAVMVNFGVLGLVLFLICLVFRIPMNGVIFGSILSILGFAGYGLHIRNVLPVWVGAGFIIFIQALITNNYTLGISTIMSFVFASGIAPICGRYGIITGIGAGILHIIITPLMINFQGGFDLYNNGFSAGFVGAIVYVLAEKIFNRGDRRGRKSKNKQNN